jgi:hypothetical protein
MVGFGEISLEILRGTNSDLSDAVAVHNVRGSVVMCMCRLQTVNDHNVTDSAKPDGERGQLIDRLF